jgi:hypothetical protein
MRNATCLLRPFVLSAVLFPLVAASPSEAHAEGAGSAAAPSPEDAKKATNLFMNASELFKAKKFSLALDQFKESYAAVPSPNSHLYIARCLAALGDTRAAWLEFNKVVDEADARAATEEKYAPTRDTARVERDELGSKLAFVTLNVSAGANVTVRVGSESIPREQWNKPLPFPPGSAEAVLEVDGKAADTKPLTLSAGDKRSVTLTPPPEEKAAPPEPTPAEPAMPEPSSGSNRLRTAAYGAGAVGVAGFVMFAVAGPISLGTYADLTNRCTKINCSPDLAGEISAGKTQQAVANVGLVIGALGAATGATLFVLSRRKKAEPADAAPPPSARLLVSPGYVGVRGAF